MGTLLILNFELTSLLNDSVYAFRIIKLKIIWLVEHMDAKRIKLHSDRGVFGLCVPDNISCRIS